ncbi:MAG: hypothetical protein KAS29_02320 [Bacteroidales bacterium]|nr:hypothetical protein [Bacteroidales bacterium]
MKKYIAELKRRNVFKAGIAYLIVAWIIAEVASVVLPTFNAPAYFMKTLLIILIIGFPINLVYAWIYDITGEGIKKTEDIDQKAQKSKFANNRLNKVIIASLSVAVVLLLFNQIRNTPGHKEEKVEGSAIVEETDIVEKSIAVLPLVNLSGDPDLEPFCEAMTDAIISRLSKISSLGRVIPRTSVFKYKGSNKSVPEIANELGVAHILESSFQKEGDQIKINLQLIDAKTDDHIWSEDYFDIFKDKFQIQAEVAEKVAGKLDVKITETEIKSIRKVPTNNEEAYNSFLLAEFQKNKSSARAFAIAIPLYEKAIALDSMFIEAYIGLGEIWLTGGCVWGTYSEKEAWGNAKTLFQKALEIDSTNTRVVDMMYDGYFYFEWDFDKVEKYYQSILHGPVTNNRSVSYYWASVDLDYLEKTGRYNEAFENINKRILFDPTVGVNYSFKAELLLLLGKKDEAIDLLEKYDPLYNNDWWYLREAAKHYFNLEEYEKSRNHLNLLMSNFEDRPPILLWLNAVYHQMDGDSREAKRYLEKLNDKYQIHASGSPAWFLALYYCTLEDYENAFNWLQKSYDRHEVEMTWFREEPLLIPVRNDPRYKDLYRKIGFPERS